MKPSVVITRNNSSVIFTWQVNTKGKELEFLLPENITLGSLNSFIQFIGEDKFLALINVGIKHFYRKLNKRATKQGKLDLDKFKSMVAKGRAINNIKQLLTQHFEISKQLISAKGKDVEKLTNEMREVMEAMESLKRNKRK